MASGWPAHAVAWQHLPSESRRAWVGFLRTHARITAVLDTHLQNEHGLSLAAFDVLLTLAGSPGHRRRMSELAELVLLSRSGLTRLVERLENRGLVERSRADTDVRHVYANLTELGYEALTAAEPDHVDAVRAHFLDRLRSDDLKVLVQIWQRLD